ncbi:MAG: bifunctional riboflavin kinase/FAD synthetase [Alphaproteobacteria bacterium]|nr:bifunctional riboflavin kinase/FAD synthetase [Alphaproteobacteria bacterium]
MSATLYTSLEGLPPQIKKSVLVIGNFDGVHIGHQQVIADARAIAENSGENVALGVMMFDPHPRRYFAPDTPAFRLTKIETRQRLLGALGVDFILALPFDEALASCPAEDFISDMLCQKLAIRAVAVGQDFRFGHKRKGTTAMLTQFAAIHGFRVAITEAVMQNNEGEEGEPYSSSAIRQHLQDGKPDAAAALLGRGWAIEGVIETGDKRGRTIGFATINMALADYLHPQFGVYAVRAHLLDGAHKGQSFMGVANLGMRPTFDTPAPRLESHLFNFDDDIYGDTASVELLHFMRAEQKFASLDALQTQIAKDATSARNYFAGI